MKYFIFKLQLRQVAVLSVNFFAQTGGLYYFGSEQWAEFILIQALLLFLVQCAPPYERYLLTLKSSENSENQKACCKSILILKFRFLLVILPLLFLFFLFARPINENYIILGIAAVLATQVIKNIMMEYWVSLDEKWSLMYFSLINALIFMSGILISFLLNLDLNSYLILFCSLEIFGLVFLCKSFWKIIFTPPSKSVKVISTFAMPLWAGNVLFAFSLHGIKVLIFPFVGSADLALIHYYKLVLEGILSCINVATNYLTPKLKKNVLLQAQYRKIYTFGALLIGFIFVCVLAILTYFLPDLNFYIVIALLLALQLKLRIIASFYGVALFLTNQNWFIFRLTAFRVLATLALMVFMRESLNAGTFFGIETSIYAFSAGFVIHKARKVQY